MKMRLSHSALTRKAELHKLYKDCKKTETVTPEMLSKLQKTPVEVMTALMEINGKLKNRQ